MDGEVGRVADGPCLVVAADGPNRCMAKAPGSTTSLAAAYLRRVVEDSCTT